MNVNVIHVSVLLRYEKYRLSYIKIISYFLNILGFIVFCEFLAVFFKSSSL